MDDTTGTPATSTPATEGTTPPATPATLAAQAQEPTRTVGTDPHGSQPTSTDPGTPEPADDADTNKPNIDWKAEARKHEARAKANAAAAKELAERKKAEMSDVDRATTEAQELRDQLAERDARIAQFEVQAQFPNLTPDDFALLEGVPADQYTARAEALSKRLAAATPTPASSGTPVSGGRGGSSNDETDPAKLAARITGSRRY